MIPDNKGKFINNFVAKTKDLYPNGFIERDCPDIQVSFGDNLWAPTDEVGTGKIYSRDTTVGKTVAVHTQFGFFIISGKNVKSRGKISRKNILDFAPTILTSLGVKLPKDLIGKPIKLV